ncbi:uncharacterized protein EKO05_0000661 [Ascochyta rabiei]|uniref:Uncharacterized protein n=1 Tax=Didymella rabiei TaxID=5454 RepID=A0A162VT65_DIDRA|nr:uncharacterized protein EKO05_0000661 [Ascochyta rabiei]KZM18608.1 hypothetical protein ST47_g10226 [Ascochyta rabiei]UPX09985.1 hypothetical protein EKO05_0000661 [Ascochyta rabiei]
MNLCSITETIPERRGRIDTPILETLDERRRTWLYLLRNQHYEPLIFDILNDELPKYATSCAIDPAELTILTRECALILASAPRVFFAAVEGSLVGRMISDTELQAEYASIQQRAHHQPSIYAHLLADDRGNAPTPNQCLVIRDMVQDYLSGDPSEHAHTIDNVTPPLVLLEASTKGYRKYLHTPSTDRSPKRVATLQRFCSGITLRYTQTSPHLHNTPLPYPPSEVGYALQAHRRLAQHRAHRSSNHVMNLVEDICTQLFRTNALTQHFEMHQFVIYLIFRPSQAAIAEIFCSGLLQCWVEGGGFNACPAGRSVASSRRVSAGQWRVYEEAAREVSLLDARMEGMKERAEVWREALCWEDEDGDVEKKGVKG